MAIAAGSPSVITATFTGPRRRSLFPKAARPAARCAGSQREGQAGSVVFRIHPNSVAIVRNGKETRFHFEQLTAFSQGRTNVRVNGAYAGTTQQFKFAIGDDHFDFNTDLYSGNTDIFNDLISRVTETLGLRMAADLAHADSIPWTLEARIHKAGVELPLRSGLRKTPQLVPWEDFTGVEFQDGVAKFFVRDKAKAVAKLPCESENFFPGMHLVEQLLQVHNENAIVQEHLTNSPELADV